MRYSKIFFRFLKLMGQALPLFLFAMIIHMVGDNFLYLTLSYFVNKLIDMAQAGSMEGLRELLIICIAANIAALAVFFVFGALYDIYFQIEAGNDTVNVSDCLYNTDNNYVPCAGGMHGIHQYFITAC